MWVESHREHYGNQKGMAAVGDYIIDPEMMNDGSTLLITVTKPGTDPEAGPCVDIWVKPDLTTAHEQSGGIE